MLRFMKNKILIPLLILTALATFFSFKYSNADQSSEERKVFILQTVVKAINESHYAPRPVDDSLSNMVYNKILNNLDYEKKFFTKADMNVLGQYQYQIDDQIKSGSIEFFEKLNGIFTKRIDNAEGYYKEILKTPFTFTANEQVELNGEKIDFATDDAALKERWRKYLKYRVLARYVDMKKDQEKKKENKDSVNAKMKTDAQMEADAREAIRKNQENYFKRLRKLNEDERFTMYVNAISNSEDPHTDYMPPKDKQKFDEAMSGTFFGIGAQLKDEEGKIKIVSVIPGSPAWKQGQLKANDEIIKVGQGAAEPEDVQGLDMDDVIAKIRGKKGTEVRLTVKKVNGATEVIPIIRGDVRMEDVFAKSAIINSSNGPVGYIYLPEFYADFQRNDGPSSSEDIAREVQKLKNAGVTGIILDLRYNGGGSLADVVNIAGLFIDQGPVVQVKSSNAGAMTLKDDQAGMLYDGPLAIMVNQGSASASEILAAAMQDYKRAVVVGSTSFGKGTVQTVRSLDGPGWLNNITNNESAANPIGSLKLTVQKFYRVNGGSTQLKGVTPDIDLPDPYEYIDMGERRDKAALKWDEIPAAAYAPVAKPVNVKALSAESKKRVAANQSFALIQQNAQRIKKQEEDNRFSLNETAFRKEQEEANTTSKKLEELEKKVTPYAISNPKEDMQKINLDSTSVKKNEDWIKNLQKDIYLAETVNIVNDLAKQSMSVNIGTGMK